MNPSRTPVPNIPQDQPLQQAQFAHQVFEAQAEARPEHPAIVLLQNDALSSEGPVLTYGQLNKAANRLAHYLIGRGLTPETFVGIAIDRSHKMVIAMLAVLKAGGAYVSLDPAYPAERFNFMVADTRCPFILTRDQVEIPQESDSQILNLDQLEDQLQTMPTSNPTQQDRPHKLLPQNLAIMVYTSGSTGRPKGVLVNHQGILNTLRSDYGIFMPRQEERSLHMSSINFGAATIHLLRPLCGGATCFLVTHIASLGAQIGTVLKTHRISHAFITGSMLAVLPEEDYPHLRCITAGGEKASNEMMARWKDRLYNVYAATETSMVATSHHCINDTDTFPVGKAVPGCGAMVLDQLELTSDKGELCVEGPGITRGYWNAPALTATKFTPNPVATEPGSRIYRTGDMGRVQEDGELLCLGRLDFLVKIRGHRVELGEIEARLSKQDGVHQCCVLAPPDAQGNNQLVAFIVPKEHTALNLMAIHATLAAQMPEYMVPDRALICASFPRTPNGKLDRRKLAEQAPEATTLTTTAYVPPETPLQKRICTIFAELLKETEIGIHHDFFKFGGDSLLANRVVGQLRPDYELPVHLVFSKPTPAELAQYLQEQSEQKEHLQRVPRQEFMPVTQGQTRMSILHQLSPAAYNVALRLNLNGPLNPTALEAALVRLISVHEPLRTSFHQQEQLTLQKIHDTTPFQLSTIDISHLEDKQSQAIEAAIDAAAQPFKLDQAPLFRVLLFRLAPEKHVATFVIHHIISDATTIRIFFRLWAQAYAHQLNPSQSDILKPAVQMADYAAWEAHNLQQNNAQEHLDWWVKHLEGIPKLVNLPTDHPRPPIATNHGDHVDFVLNVAQVQVLEQHCQQHHITPFMLYRAVLGLVLARYANQNDITIGVGAAKRDHVHTQEMMGFLVDTLAMRANFGQNQTYQNLISAIRTETLEVYRHGDTPFQQIIEATQPPRDTSHAPIFQTLIIAGDLPRAPQFPGLKTQAIPLDATSARFDLTLYIKSFSQGQRLFKLEFNRDLFTHKTASRLHHHVQQLLTNLPLSQAPLWQWSMLNKTEKDLLLNTWNQSTTIQMPFPMFHGFLQAVSDHPKKVAVIHKQQHITYEALHERAASIAASLAGLESQSLIGLMTQRTPDMLAAALGIQMAGCAYLPLDPNFPAQRLQLMLDDAACPLILCDAASKPKTHIATRILENIANPPLEEMPCVHPKQIAYTIYTSGSTGKPKGVQISHRAAHNFLQSMIYQLPVNHTDRLLAVTTLSFDIHVLECFAPLHEGGTVVLASSSEAADPKALSNLIAEHNITIMQATPITWRLLLAANWQGKYPMKALVGGEAFSAQLADELIKRRLEVWNMYGPTETTVWSAITPVHEPHPSGTQAIGPPIASTDLHILDSYGQLLPPGIPGELFIGGAGLARGYRGQPALTALRFRPHPFSRIPGSRIYCTGDLCRRQDDGDIAFLGRIDQQVKVRGFRIELGDIESTIEQHPDISRAIVVTHTDASQQKTLRAFIKDDLNLSDLRQWLTKRLPEYMIPSPIDIISEWPTTPNGKIDRKQLANRPLSQQHKTPSSHRPWSDTETRLVAIWERVLKRDGIQIEDNFFSLGGHSLLAIQLFSQIQDAFNKTIELPTLFQSPTVQALAQHIQERGTGQEQAAVVALKRGSKEVTPLFCLCGLFIYRDLALALKPQQGVYGVYVPEEVNLLQAGGDLPSMEEMAQTYMEQIRKAQPHGPYRLAGVSYGGLLAFEVARQLREAGEEVEALVMFDTILRSGLKKQFIPWLGFHLSNVLGKGPAYILERLKRRFNRNRKLANVESANEALQAGLGEDGDFPMFRGQLYRHASDRYTPQPAPGVHILFRAEALELPKWYAVDENLGWKPFTPDGLKQNYVPGDHLGMLTQPNVQQLADALQTQLDNLDQN